MTHSARSLTPVRHAVIAVVLTGAAHLAGAQAVPWEVSAADAARPNPVTADAASVEKGRALYVTNCLPCHGATGKGDGPAASALTTRPADFNTPMHRAHSDGALFTKITTGRPPMPAWSPALSDTDRWNLVNYLRALTGAPHAAKAPASKAAASAGPAATPPRPEAMAMAAPPEPAVPPTAAPVASTAPGSEWVPRAEYEQLRAELDALKARVDQLAAGEASRAPAASPDGGVASATDVAEMKEQIEEVQRVADLGRPGKTQFLATGYGFVDYSDVKGSPSTFDTTLSSILLWQPTARMLASTELEVALEDSETAIDMEFFYLSYEINDNLTFVTGKFLTPFSKFKEDLHPAWINPLPDQPPYADGDWWIIPESVMGAELRGAVASRSGNTRFNWAAYVANGPQLLTEGSNIGGLNFKNYLDDGQNKAVGARLALLPVPSVEIGYAAQVANVAPGSEPSVDATLQEVDLSFGKEFAGISGRIQLRAEYDWSHVGRHAYVDMATGLPLPDFGNSRNGGYLQASYRPSRVEALKDWEVILRHDWLGLPKDPTGSLGFFDERRTTLGIDYWLGPSTAAKVAYTWDDKSAGFVDENALTLQFTFGF
jgi:mono/diheme cytochrome c family protein